MKRALPLLLRGALAANRLRLALTVACIALGVALAGAVHTVHTSALAEIDHAARLLAGAADIEVRGPRSGFDDALFLVIARRPEVEEASPVVEVEAALADGRGTLRVLGIDPMRAVRLQPAFVAGAAKTGAAESATLLDPRNAWISPAAARRLRLREGDTLRLVSGAAHVDLSVAGLLPGLESAGELAVIDIASAQAQFARFGLLTRIDVRLRGGASADRFHAAVAPLLPPGVVTAAAASISERAAAITRAYRVNLDALALVALATGAFLVFSTLALQAARRRQEFATLRALGVTRAELAALLALEGAIIGAIGAAIGTALGIGASVVLLRGSGADLGAGFFGGVDVGMVADPLALGAIAAIGVAMSVGGALWVARSVGRIPVAEALRDRTIDLPAAAGPAGVLAAVLALAGIALLYAPAIGGLPLGGYAAIGAWIAATVVSVAPVCSALLGRFAPTGPPVTALALAQVRHLPGHLAASIAGIVVSAALCAAMAIMVHSFRVSLEDWLGGVVGADLYLRTGAGGETGYLTATQQAGIAALPEVSGSEALRYDRLAMTPEGPPLTLIARPINARILAGFQAEPRSLPPASDETPVWISEAARDLQGWQVGEAVTLPIAGRGTVVRVAGVVRDYARTWGAVLVPIEAYRRITGDERANDLAIHLAPGIDARRARDAIERALPEARGLAFEDAGELRRRSLEIFDRSFAVTYALEAIAVAIGLAGVTSSFAALAWSRRREFGMLRFLGFTRGEVLRLLTLEGALAGTLGAVLGLVAGAATGLVLIYVVNRQAFHWSVETHWPLGALAALFAAVIAACALGARLSAAVAVRSEAILAVKDDA